MANNELFYRVAREALDDDTSIAGLVIDLGLAIESYVQARAEDDVDDEVRVREVREAVPHAERLVRDVRATRDWLTSIAPPEEVVQ